MPRELSRPNLRISTFSSLLALIRGRRLSFCLLTGRLALRCSPAFLFDGVAIQFITPVSTMARQLARPPAQALLASGRSPSCERCPVRLCAAASSAGIFCSMASTSSSTGRRMSPAGFLRIGAYILLLPSSRGPPFTGRPQKKSAPGRHPGAPPLMKCSDGEEDDAD